MSRPNTSASHNSHKRRSAADLRPRGGRFIVLEGPDKSGKSTQAALLVQALAEHGLKPVHTREPGGTSFAEAIRSLLLNAKHKIAPLAELLLYEAARAQHTAEIIRPALKAGRIVISERYTLATMAYQGHARGLGEKLCGELNRIATQGLQPDLTIVLDVPETAFKRRDPGRTLDRLEQETSAFRRKVRDAYRKLARRDPKIIRMDGTGDRHPIHVELVRLTSRFVRGTLRPLPQNAHLLKS